jgi:hypothetical protein
MFTRHEEFSGTVNARADDVFALLDDQTRLSAHMSRRSWKMGWGRMEVVFDDKRGKTVGSHIGLHGRVFGIRLFLDEVVIEREIPIRKVWETVGEPRLLVIGAYRMGFTIAPRGSDVSLTVGIDYDLPGRGVSRLLALMFGRAYAKWCTRQMVHDAQRAFTRTRASPGEHVAGAVR